MQANVIRTALVQNVGDAELQFFAVFRTSQYEEMSLSDWLRHSPPEMVAQPLECGRSDNLEVAEQSAAHYARVTEPGLAEITVPNLLPSVARLPRTASLAGHLVAGQRLIPEEMAIAFTFNGSTHAVMMATPADLEDFAVGLSVTEGIIEAVEDISDLEIVSSELGVELRMWIPDTRMQTIRCGVGISRAQPDAACAASRA